MGAKRKSNLNLPERVYVSHGSYFYVPKLRLEGCPAKINLGRDIGEALLRYRELTPCFRLGPGREFSAEVRRLFKSSLSGARDRGIPFNITLTHIRDLFIRANGKCELTGIKFSNEVHAGSGKRPWAPSIDRRESSKGYEPDNVRLVCISVNIALSDFGDEILKKIAESLTSTILQS